MAVVTQIPAPSQPLTGDKGIVTTPWFQFFMHIFNTVSPGGGPAPANGGYVVTAADPSLPNARVATSSATVTVDVTTPGIMRWHATGASGSGWAPLSTGAEPLVLVSDGAGQCVMVPYP